jgi:hypothetical protein
VTLLLKVKKKNRQESNSKKIKEEQRNKLEKEQTRQNIRTLFMKRMEKNTRKG